MTSASSSPRGTCHSDATSRTNPSLQIRSGTGPGSVTPVNTTANTAGKPIRVGVRPFAIAITPAGTTAYVANIGSDTVTPVNTATDRPGKPIRVGVSPFAIAITP